MLAGAATSVAVSCAPSTTAKTVSPSYDTYSGQLIQLTADQDGNGRVDQWTYLVGTRPLRGEKDTDEDGRIDRWEYFGPQAELLSVGTSSRHDGIEDTWTWVRLVNGEGRVDLSLTRDRHIDKREYYAADVITHAELDTNADGRIDRWDRFENRVLREVQFDNQQGQFIAAEADDDRDGHFDRLSPGTKVIPPGGTSK
jgi:hypothetical protein